MLRPRKQHVLLYTTYPKRVASQNFQLDSVERNISLVLKRIDFAFCVFNQRWSKGKRFAQH